MATERIRTAHSRILKGPPVGHPLLQFFELVCGLLCLEFFAATVLRFSHVQRSRFLCESCVALLHLV